jgi:hypothetical protein
LIFSHAGGSGALMNDTRPFGYHIEQHGPLPLVHSGSFHPFWHNRLAILPWTEYKIRKLVAQNGSLPLIPVQSL